MKITVVGLGSGDVSRISYGALRAIQNAKKIFLRTNRHPIVDFFVEQKISFDSFDNLYEEKSTFEEVYQTIVNQLFDSLEQYEEIVYAVPGHPKVAETSIELLQNDARIAEKNIEIEVIPSGSFLDDFFVFLGVDPSKRGFTLLDALQFDVQSIYSKTDLVFTQVFSKKVASDLKIALLEHLQDECAVILFKAAGVKGVEEKMEIPLYEMDQCDFEFDHLTSVFISSDQERYRYKTIFDLMDIIAKLRSEDGCPWDKVQNATSIIPNMREEMDELILAIQNDDIDNIIEEIGDVLMLLTMQARFGEEAEYFNMFDAIDGIANKLIFRHPHVFGNSHATSLDEANKIWSQQKIAEKNQY